MPDRPSIFADRPRGTPGASAGVAAAIIDGRPAQIGRPGDGGDGPAPGLHAAYRRLDLRCHPGPPAAPRADGSTVNPWHASALRLTLYTSLYTTPTVGRRCRSI